MSTDRELLLYIASKVARLDATTTAIHAMLYAHNRPAGDSEREGYRIATQSLYEGNIAAEKQHLENQFPDDYKTLCEYIDLGESEIREESEDRTFSSLIDLLEMQKDTDQQSEEPPDADDASDEKK